MKFKAAIIGTGRIGYLFQNDKKREQPAAHSIALKKNKNIKITAGCDLNSERLQAWHKDFPKANVYDNHVDLLKNETLDIIVIAVDEKSHLQVTLDSIKANPKLIILEKPVALNPEDARKIKENAKKQKVPICINHERRFSKDYILIKEILNNNELGDVQSIRASLWSGMKAWTRKSEKDGACSLIHDGTHLVDILRFISGFDLTDAKIDKIISKSKNEVDSIFLHYNINNKTILYMEINGKKKFFGFEIDIICSKGRAIIGNGYLKIYKSHLSKFYTGFNSLKRERKYRRPKKTRYFSNMVENCVKYLEGETNLASNIDDGIKALETLYGIIDKLKQIY